MKTRRGLLAAWVLAGIAFWLLALRIASNWATHSGPGSQPEAFILAVLVASVVTGLLVGVVALVRRRRRPGLVTALAMMAVIAFLTFTLQRSPITVSWCDAVFPAWATTNGGCGPQPQWWEYLWPPDRWFAGEICTGVCLGDPRP